MLRSFAIVDDDADTRLLASVVLNRAGHMTLEDDGSPGVGLRLAAHSLDAILLDLHLDGRSGIEALREIRAMNALADTPVFAFTGARDDDPLLREIAAHIAGRIQKPVDPVQLENTLTRFFPGEEPESAPEIDLDAVRQRFLDGLHDRARRIERALSVGDAGTLAFEVHRLRGAAGSYGLDDVANAAETAETAIQGGQPGETVQHLLAVVRQVIEND